LFDTPNIFEAFPMSYRLPPLPAIRAFEAAARLGGFQSAGAELHVSAGAVAHHVKQLEAWLGVALFQRLARGVALTSAGHRYAEALRPLLAGLADASEAARHHGDERVVTVTSVPSLVARWLMPRLGRLRECGCWPRCIRSTSCAKAWMSRSGSAPVRIPDCRPTC